MTSCPNRDGDGSLVRWAVNPRSDREEKQLLAFILQLVYESKRIVLWDLIRAVLTCRRIILSALDLIAPVLGEEALWGFCM